MAWEENQGDISIRQGGPTPGCVVVTLFLIGGGFLAVGILMYLGKIGLPFAGYHLPIAVFTGFFGLFWILASVNARRSSVESVVVIDTFNKAIRFQAHRTDKVTTIPFSYFQAVILHETKVQDTSYVSTRNTGSTTSRPTTTFTYRIYLHRTDGSIFWLDNFSGKKDAVEHTQMLLDRIEISCIDEAGGALSRTVANPYTNQVSAAGAGDTTPFLRITEQSNGDTAITVRYERLGVGGFLAVLFLLALFIGCPVWFFSANLDILPGWFLIIPSVFAFFAFIGIFLRGRRYTLVCSPVFLDMRVQFWFPLFQLLFGKSARLKATALRAVRVNRYDGGELHLEIAVDNNEKLPGLTRAAFNSGAVRMLPRAVTDNTTQHLGMWAILPLAKKGAGPTMADLFAAETKIQNIYRMDSSIA
jgi:hypothetical protein